ncbi:MAG: BTAD domain-containing putative transcriptional regulator [Microthrixaceae bacterium]
MDEQLIVCVLGPCIVSPLVAGRADSADAVEPSAIQRRILGRLALSKPGSATIDELADAIWGEEQPATAQTSVYNQISRIRGRLGPGLIETSSDGRYQLTVPTDVEVVTDLVQAADAALTGGVHGEAVKLTRRALDYWRGTPYSELDDHHEATVERRRLIEMRRSLETLRLEGSIGAGGLAWAITEAERLVTLTPDDEHRWVLLIKALESAGRRGDALGAYERARRSLAERLGLEPSQALRDAEVAVLGSRESHRSPSTISLIGREDMIEAALDACDKGIAVVLIGEPGIGKSRILTEVQRRLRRRGGLVVGSDAPQHADTAVGILRELADGLGESLVLHQSPIDSFVLAVGRAVEVADRLTLTVDDIDRAGPTTIEALRAAGRLDGVSVVVSATDPVALIGWDGWAQSLTLQPLEPRELAEFAAVALDSKAGVDQNRLGWLIEMSGGNPAFLEHLLEDPLWLAHLDESSERGLERQHPMGQLRSPHLRDVIRMRLDRLGHTTRTALEVAAVCGQECPAEVLAELVGPEGAAGGLAAALLSSFETTDGAKWIGFRHGAVQQVLYQDLSPGRRMEIHYHAALVLRSHGAPVPVVAWHSCAAAEVDPVSAARDAMSAAVDATDHGAHADAALWYQRAIEAAQKAGNDEEQLVRALIGYGDSLRRSGSTDQEVALFAAARAAFELGDEELISEAAFAVLQLGATTPSGQLHERAIELARQALETVHGSDARALISGGASLAHSMSTDAELCRRHFLEAVAGATSSITRSRVLPFAYLGVGHPKDLNVLEELTTELAALGNESADPVTKFEARQMAFSVALQRCDGASARRVVLESGELIEQIGDVGRRWSLAYQRAAIAFLDGDMELAESTAEKAMAIFSPTSPSRAFAAYGGQILMIRIMQGRVAELASTAEGLVADQPGVPAWHAALALAIATEDPTRALSHAVSALEHCIEDFTWMAAHIVGGRAAALLGDETVGERYIARLTPFSGLGCWQGTCSYGPVDTVLWQLHESLGRTEAAELHLGIAKESAERLKAPVFLNELVC